MAPRSSLLLCAFALVVAAATVAITLVTPFDEPLIVFVLPCMASAYWGGLRPGLVATGVVAVGAVLAVQPRLKLGVANGKDVAEIIVLVVVGTFASVLCDILRRARDTSEENYARYREMTAAAEQLKDRLRQAQKMEAIGQLAGGVAHDFNNMLAVVSGSIELLGESIAPDHADRALVDEIELAVVRAQGLTRQLLAFSRKQVTAAVVLDLNATVAETRQLLRRILGEDILLSMSLEPELAHICIDPGALVQVMMNLAVNARDAMPGGGTLGLTTRSGERSVTLAVSDTGSGMPPEVLARIFQPFFTTKDLGRGTGMGLSVVHGIVEEAKGRVEVESTVGVGTTFRIHLPTTEAPLPATRKAAAGSHLGGHDTLLVVDDDEYVRRATVRSLRSRGYTVYEASTGRAALELLSSVSLITLLITDVVMPGGDGRALAEAARERFPELKVLYISGYPDDDLIRHGVKHGSAELLEKPFRIDALVAKIHQLLAAPAMVA